MVLLVQTLAVPLPMGIFCTGFGIRTAHFSRKEGACSGGEMSYIRMLPFFPRPPTVFSSGPGYLLYQLFSCAVVTTSLDVFLHRSFQGCGPSLPQWRLLRVITLWLPSHTYGPTAPRTTTLPILPQYRLTVPYSYWRCPRVSIVVTTVGVFFPTVQCTYGFFLTVVRQSPSANTVVLWALGTFGPLRRLFTVVTGLTVDRHPRSINTVIFHSHGSLGCLRVVITVRHT